MKNENLFDVISYLENFINDISHESIRNRKIEENKRELQKVLKELKVLKQNDFEFREIGDNLYDGIYISDGDGNTLYVNKAYTRITGIKPEEIVGKNVKEILKEGKLYKNAVTMEVLKSKRQVNSVGVSLRNGKKMLITGSPIFDKQGNIKKVVINNREMTDLLEIRKELDASIDKLKAVEEHHRKNKEEIRHLRNINVRKYDLIGRSQSIKNVYKIIDKVAETDVTVLIYGETGVGKEVVANEIYLKSKRNNAPFIKVNCGAIPSNLIESELFGYEKGAFTGANASGKVGMFELANKGTILLDEIGEMPIEVQSKLLRAIQQKEIIRVGGTKPISLDVRLISSTNKDLKQEVKHGTFREDLYYRLNVIPIYIPPLRTRIEDIDLLTEYFINNFNKQYNKSVNISNLGVDILKQYSWPGNIRELQNIIERMIVITEDNSMISDEQLGNILNINSLNITEFLSKEMGLREIVENIERKTLEKVLAESGSTRKAAKILKVDQSTIVKKAKRLGIKIS
ncbi:nitrogen assimilation regulatory protein [Clostridium homopropionicum DSM 5847]|uniref:HTH-type transcriptional regulatory protein TyrR n=1 Tax=Clostridium homopropionicum DSM 5847 TaxID=1121318 RepID=A0A0L6Z595_9CLOT|nr:sigma 54-interacting transcriptional regulator [Clostridium homopropionicum]KOA18132.1 nitrogen assimilation regulatory protein [Clostridium homopropionicum DSM 5847]SFG96462.1 PAS domain S-box-containing protein [Clostridium homopropionicum]